MTSILNRLNFVFNIKFLLYSFICLNTLVILIKLFQYNNEFHCWILGDWLINYEDGGFKRRGLSGTFFFFLQDHTFLSLPTLVASVQSIICIVFFSLFICLLKTRVLTIKFFTFVLSPLTLLFYINNIYSIGRKEWIVFLLFTLLIFWGSRNKLNFAKHLILCLGLSLSTFLHEITFFYIPYFIIYLYFFLKEKQLKMYALYFLSTLIPVVLLFLLGKNINEGQTLHLLEMRGVGSPIELGILGWANKFDFLSYYREHFINYSGYVLTLLLGAGHLLLVFTNTSIKKQLLLSFLFAFLFTLPVFVLAVDWGRWLHIHFMLILILFTQLLPKDSPNISWKQSNILVQRPQWIYLLLFPILFTWNTENYRRGFSLDGLAARVYFESKEFITGEKIERNTQ